MSATAKAILTGIWLIFCWLVIFGMGHAAVRFVVWGDGGGFCCFLVLPWVFGLVTEQFIRALNS